MRKECRRPGLGLASAAAVAAAVLCCVLPYNTVQANDALNVDVADAFAFSGRQLAVLADEVLTEVGIFTDYTDTDGQWETEKESGDPITQTVWTSGMVAGMYWYQYEATGDEIWKTRAEFSLAGLEGVEELDDNDTGFQVYNSFGLGYRLTNEAEYAERVLTGADTLYGFRWQENIAAFWSWENPSRRPEWDMAVNVDMMMNMEIMLWASANGGDPYYADAVVGHAETTWADIVRDDNSTFHVADYDPDTGVLVDQGTYQGWIDSSTWSRGQAWAIYGYVMVHRFLNEQRFIDMSVGVLKYYEDNLPEDLIPLADFDAPDTDENGKDSSASAIVCSALFELFLATEDATYLMKAQEFLAALLSPDHYLPNATDGYQSILRRATSRWSDPETGAVFGDYFLLEAMVRYQRLAPSILLWQKDRKKIRASVREMAYFGRALLEDDVDLSHLDATAPVLVWLSMKLGTVHNTPTELVLESEAGDMMKVTIPAPTNGWIDGENSVKFELPEDALVSGTWDKVVKVSFEFDIASSAPTQDAFTRVDIRWLILTNELTL